VLLVGVHVLMVRLRGVVPPFAPPGQRPVEAIPEPVGTEVIADPVGTEASAPDAPPVTATAGPATSTEGGHP
jgi:hypothetical protein